VVARLPRALALSKADLVPDADAETAAALWRERLGEGVPVIVTSSATGAGLDELATTLLRLVPPEAAAPLEPDLAAADGLAEHRVFRPAADRGFEVSQTGPHTFRVDGEGIARLLARHDLDNDEALAWVEERLRRIGVIRALEERGFEPGDEVEIAGIAFELDPS
jgi:GTP-binding protein